MLLLSTTREIPMTDEITRTSLYLKRKILVKFKENCKREGESMSGKVEAFMFHYNQAHSNGNPQQKISVYANPEEPQPMRVLCLFLNGALSNGKIHCRRAGMWIPGVRCYSCEENSLRKP